MNDAQTFDHESPQGDMTFGSAIGLKFTLAFPGAFMKKILPAVLMLCALAAGSQPVCAATDNQLMREEITAGMTDPAVIEGSADAFGFSGEKAEAYADFIRDFAASRLFLDHVVEQFKKAGIDGAKLRAVHDHGTSDELAALSEEILQGSLLLTQRLMAEGVPYSSPKVMEAEMRTTKALCGRLSAKACRDLNLVGAQGLAYDDLDAAARTLTADMSEEDVRKMFRLKIESIENALRSHGEKPAMSEENVRLARAAYSVALEAALERQTPQMRERFEKTMANLEGSTDGDVCDAFGIIYGAILDTVPEDPEGNVLKSFFTGKLF